MRKILAAGLVTGAIAAAAAMTVMGAQITEARAKEIALGHAGVSSDNVGFIFAKTDWEHGVQVYDVEFITKDYKEYDYEIKADDGTVMSYDYDAEQSFYSSIPTDRRNIQIDVEKAKEIALDHAGRNAADVSFVKANLEYDDGLASYEVEFFSNDGKEYDYEISAYTGEIIGYDYDAEAHYYYSNASYGGGGNAQRESSSASTGEAVSQEEAKNIALNQAGLQASEVSFIQINPDYDDGRLQYEGKFFHGALEYEFEIDAASGRITDWDVENIYD